MPVARFEIARTGFIDATGDAVGELPQFARDRTSLTALYRGMVQARAFDTRAITLQRTGRIGTYPSALGQEAVGIGLAAAMRPNDVLVPSFREHGAQLWRGASATELLLYWGGDERGNSFAAAPEDFPTCVPVGSQAPHAVGVALAFQLRKEPRVAVCVLGDGATSKGDVAEALNLAGVWRLPLVFVVVNNGWAISVPRARQSAAETLAQKAIGAGVPGEQVDGNDVVAVRHIVGEAVERARGGAGPAWVEALTYRLGDHTTADDARRYRDDSEVSAHWPAEPIARLRNFLTRQHGWTKDEEEAVLGQANATIDAAVERYLAMPAQGAATIFDFTYSTLPADLVAQRDALLGSGA